MRGYSRSSLVIGSKQAEPGTWQGIRFLEASRNCSAIEARLRPLFVLHAEVRSAARRAGASVPPLPRIGPTCSPAQSPSGPAGDTWPHRRSGPCCCCPVRSPGQRRPAPPKSTARRLRGSMPTPSCAACDHLLLGVSRSFESRTARWISGSSPNSAVCDNQSATKSTQIALMVALNGGGQTDPEREETPTFATCTRFHRLWEGGGRRRSSHPQAKKPSAPFRKPPKGANSARRDSRRQPLSPAAAVCGERPTSLPPRLAESQT